MAYAPIVTFQNPHNELFEEILEQSGVHASSFGHILVDLLLEVHVAVLEDQLEIALFRSDDVD